MKTRVWEFNIKSLKVIDHDAFVNAIRKLKEGNKVRYFVLRYKRVDFTVNGSGLVYFKYAIRSPYENITIQDVNWRGLTAENRYNVIDDVKRQEDGFVVMEEGSVRTYTRNKFREWLFAIPNYKASDIPRLHKISQLNTVGYMAWGVKTENSNPVLTGIIILKNCEHEKKVRELVETPIINRMTIKKHIALGAIAKDSLFFETHKKDETVIEQCRVQRQGDCEATPVT